MGARLASARATRVSAASSGRCWFLPAAAWGSAAERGSAAEWGSAAERGPQPGGSTAGAAGAWEDPRGFSFG